MSRTTFRIRLLAVALSLSSTLVLAAPGGQPERGDDRQPRQQQQQQQQQQPRQQQGQQQKAQQAHPSSGADARSNHQQAKPADTRSQPNRSGPPADLSQVERTLRDHRNEIGRGGPVPAHVQLVKGKPLPQGYGKRLPDATLARLPRYDGYEWRRVGSDMVLVAVTTGIIYAIFNGVLN
ncbi:anti-virulence regulator CigR family protein [Stutzerimonas azotifigens]|uniref:anti-virulence regulator CigR family protein n=1 Tax=Stutzerimonas azotifigens TaxID=291995 RepID=UPI0005BE5D3F|nr:anti-virulence regulator CigR family protein [Stutzerimonas azotifigens]